MTDLEKIDPTCKLIMISLLDGDKDYAQLQRAINAGSNKAVKSHVKHLSPTYVSVKKEPRGLRTFYKLSLTEEGKTLAKNTGGK